MSSHRDKLGVNAHFLGALEFDGVWWWIVDD
jgi:hypothetical protein